MWLADYITGGSSLSPDAVKGNVSGVQSDTLSVSASGEHKQIKVCSPYGLVSVTPHGECAVVLPLDDGAVSIGVLAKSNALEEGEVMLYSKGGASIILKNNGKVLINGKEVSA